MTSQTEPDHITIGAQSNDHTAHLAGVTLQHFFTDAEVFTRAQLLVSEYYNLDVPINFWDVYNVEAEAMGQEIEYPANGLPDVNRRKPLITSPADLDRITPPDPYTSGRLPWIRKVNKL